MTDVEGDLQGKLPSMNRFDGDDGKGGENVAQDVSLDLSFGETPMEFQKVNLLGSRLQQAAIYSLVLSLNSVTYLDIRGNNLDSSFGWRLIKAMKKKYLQLEFCNGVNVKAIRENKIRRLNLASFENHSGLYGIEVVGAIFLAHFLRLNSSLRQLSFRRNMVQKDGAKALAQSMIGNTKCEISGVNMMRPNAKQRTGIDFTKFRTNEVKEAPLGNCSLDDDDIVFLEEWLLRHDCVTNLDLSNNFFWLEGVRKLHRYIINTKALKILNLASIPIDLEGVSLLAKALSQNTTLERCDFPTRACLGIQKEKQVVMHQLAVGIAKHPTLSLFGNTPMKVNFLKEDDTEKFNLARVYASQSKSEIALYLWLVAVLVPDSMKEFNFGTMKSVGNEYPDVNPYPVSFAPPLNNCVHEMRNTFVKINLCVATGMDGLAVQIMRHLRASTSLKELHLKGYAAAMITEVPQDWATDGRLPSWIRERLGPHRKHWQVLTNFLSELKTLEVFNNVPVKQYDADSAERALLLLLECVDGVVCQLGPGDDDSTHVSLSITCKRRDLDLSFAFDVFRLVDKLIYDIDLWFIDNRPRYPTWMAKIKETQLLLAKYFQENMGNKSIPPFVHNLRIRSQDTADELVRFCRYVPLIREFGLERIEEHLDTLVNVFCTKPTKHEIEKIRIDRKWLMTRRIPKLYSERERENLKKLQQAMISDTVAGFMLLTSAEGEIGKDRIAEMNLTEFGAAVAGISIERPDKGDVYDPQMYVECVTNVKDYYYPDLKPEEERDEKLYLELPVVDTSLQLRKVSLCMVGLRRMCGQIRCDEWASSSKPLWATIRSTLKIGQMLDDDLPSGGFEKIADMEYPNEIDMADVNRFHWDGNLKLGTEETWQRGASENSKFEVDFLRTCIESLLSSPTIVSLDLRGNYLDKNDCLFLISLLEKNTTLLTLNQIPVVVDDAQGMSSLVFDYNGISVPPRPLDGQEIEEEENCCYCVSSFQNDYVRMDEGDGYLFASLVTSSNFPEIKAIQIRKHAINDSTLAYICDALLALPTLEELHFSRLSLSNRGANLLLSAVSEIAPRLKIVNGIPLTNLMHEKKGISADAGEAMKGALLAGIIEWNDFSLGLMSRLKLWPFTVWPAPRDADPFVVEGQNITDVGVRGLCGLLKCFGPEGALRDNSMPNITQLNFSRNLQLTDAAVAVLCKALQAHCALPSLTELSVRYCPKLNARSAFELYQLLQYVSATSVGLAGGDSKDKNARFATRNLKILNGIDLATLNTNAEQGKPLPPCVVRVESNARESSDIPILSECDCHFFAHVLHTYPAIPHLHVHIVVASEDQAKVENALLVPPTRNNGIGSTSTNFTGGSPQSIMEQAIKERANALTGAPSNDRPFPPPVAAKTKLQAELETILRFFEACPVSMRIQLSIIPKLPVEGKLRIIDDGHILLTQNTAEDTARKRAQSKHIIHNESWQGPGGIFGYLVEKLIRAKKKRVKREWLAKNEERADEEKEPYPVPTKPLYVNNINSQRMHDCFRTLYGNDDINLMHSDIFSDIKARNRISFPQVDYKILSGMLSSVSSLDLQHLYLTHSPLTYDLSDPNTLDLSALTHMNLGFNNLGDTGVVDMFNSLVKCGATIVHISVQANSLSDIAAISIAHCLQSLPRLSSINLAQNNITESGAMALAESIGGSQLVNSDVDTSLLNVLSVDLGSNRVRELGALRFAEMVAMHPTIQFLCLGDNEIAVKSDEAFAALVYAAAASSALAVLDLKENFKNQGAPPDALIKKLLAEPLGDFDPAEMKEGVFIRRKPAGR